MRVLKPIAVGLLLTVLVALPAVAAEGHSPTIAVKTRPAYTQNPITFVARNLRPFTWWKLEMHNPAPTGRSDEINLGHHQASHHGILRFTHRAIGMRGAHFGRRTYEVWVVNLIEPHPVGNEPGPYSTEFRMFRGCGCGGR